MPKKFLIGSEIEVGFGKLNDFINCLFFSSYCCFIFLYTVFSQSKFVTTSDSIEREFSRYEGKCVIRTAQPPGKIRLRLRLGLRFVYV